MAIKYNKRRPQATRKPSEEYIYGHHAPPSSWHETAQILKRYSPRPSRRPDPRDHGEK